MFDYVEQPIRIRENDYSPRRQASSIVVQQGLQPVYFVQGDISSMERPQSLLNSLWRRGKKRKA